MQTAPERSLNFSSRVPALRILSWSAGGYTQAMQDEALLWLSTDRPHILCLQETHWTYSCEYKTAGYYHVADSAAVKGAGLFSMVSEQLCSTQNVRSRTLIAGRLQHVRLQLSAYTVDVVNACQAAWQTQCAQHCQQQRREPWVAFHQLISSLLGRSHLLLAGDFNTGLEYWLCLSPRAYEAPTGKSQIDFIIAGKASLGALPIKLVTVGWLIRRPGATNGVVRVL